MNEKLIINFKSNDPSFTLVFEDDAKVAYAYLKQDGKIVGDVWLYNRCLTPETPEWTDRNKIPFANCKKYTDEEGVIKKGVEVQDILVDWEYKKLGPVAYIYIFDDLYGVVGVNDKPGYARYAKKNGPLAHVMKKKKGSDPFKYEA